MKKKIFVQILLTILILIIFFIVYQKYFKKVSNLNVTEIEEESTNQENNLVNITYDSIDKKGRKYIITAESGTFNDEKPELIYMSNVNAEIILQDGSIIYIESLNAEYNTSNYDTKFQKEVKLKFLEHNIFCNNLNIFLSSDKFFKDNLLEAYNDLTYKNLDIIMLADKIEIDLLTKNTKIFNYKDKVQIKKKKLNGNN